MSATLNFMKKEKNYLLLMKIQQNLKTNYQIEKSSIRLFIIELTFIHGGKYEEF